MRDLTAQMWNIFCFPLFLCQSTWEKRPACSTYHVCAHACEAPDTNARRAKVWGNATALLDNCEEHDEMYLLFYLKVGGKIRCYAGPLLVYILGSYIVFFFVEAIFCVFFFKTAYLFTCTLTIAHWHRQTLPMKITVICAIRCPFLQAPRCLSEFLNACSLSMSLY